MEIKIKNQPIIKCNDKIEAKYIIVVTGQICHDFTRDLYVFTYRY